MSGVRLHRSFHVKEAYAVSVIIPVYNRKKELPDCFRSLENQTYRDYEVILVDDGSTDGTAALC